MMATLSGLSSLFVGALLSARSATNRFRSQTARGSSREARLHSTSQGCEHILPNTPGRGRFSLMSWRAS